MKCVKTNAIKILLSFLVLLIIFTLFYIVAMNEAEITNFTLPRDEGRHPSYNESWYVGFHLTAENGEVYSFIAVYGMKTESNKCYKLATFTDISNDEYVFKTYEEKPDDYHLDTQKLNITYDYFWGVDQWYQIDDNPSMYYYTGGLLDQQGEPIILNCTMHDTKGVIQMNESFINSLITNNKENVLNYYAQTNLKVNGTLLLNGSTRNVSGTAWIDKQWGEKLYPQRYEWFAIQLSNDYEIATAKIHLESEIKTYALLINPDGDIMDISKDTTISTLNKTEEGFSKTWNLKSNKINLSIQATMDRQLINRWPSILIFEGCCHVTGTFQSEWISGNCFSEQNP